MIKAITALILFLILMVFCIFLILQDPIYIIDPFALIFVFFAPIIISIPYGFIKYIIEGLSIISNNKMVDIDKYETIQNSYKFFQNVSSASGVLGFFIGAVYFTFNFVTDKTAVGPGFSFAIISPIYGLIFAYVIYYPIRMKIKNIYCDSFDKEGKLV